LIPIPPVAEDADVVIRPFSGEVKPPKHPTRTKISENCVPSVSPEVDLDG
jgi:hypothetical protein